MGNDLPSAPRRYLRIERRGDYTIATVLESKIVTEALIQEFGDELYRVAEDPAISTLIMDCKRLHYLSSAGMGKFINTKKKLGRGLRLGPVRNPPGFAGSLSSHASRQRLSDRADPGPGARFPGGDNTSFLSHA